MHCPDHPYRSSPAGAICPFCLRDRLSRLVSSSFRPLLPSSALDPSSSASSPPSFRSDSAFAHSRAAAAAAPRRAASRVPFFPHKQKVTKVMSSSAADATAAGCGEILTRSRSVAVSKLSGESPRLRRGLMSLLHLSRRRADRRSEAAEADGRGSPCASPGSSASSGRKLVTRSRSVSCGSARGFSGDFLERISTGLGECGLRRVESQREVDGAAVAGAVARRASDERIKECVKCGGIFGMMSSSSSSVSSFSSSSHWLAHEFPSERISGDAHGRSRSWSWAFASPMRAFRPSIKPSTYSTTAAVAGPVASAESSSDRRGAPPSLLTVGG